MRISKYLVGSSQADRRVDEQSDPRIICDDHSSLCQSGLLLFIMKGQEDGIEFWVYRLCDVHQSWQNPLSGHSH